MQREKKSAESDPEMLLLRDSPILLSTAKVNNCFVATRKPKEPSTLYFKKKLLNFGISFFSPLPTLELSSCQRRRRKRRRRKRGLYFPAFTTAFEKKGKRAKDNFFVCETDLLPPSCCCPLLLLHFFFHGQHFRSLFAFQSRDPRDRDRNIYMPVHYSQNYIDV